MLKKIYFSIFVLLNTLIHAATFTVTNNGDNSGIDPNPGDGTGTLRQAIIDANDLGGTNTIDFSGNFTITLSANLPIIISNTTIDGGATPNTASIFGGTLNPTYRISITSTVLGANTLINLGTSNNCIIKGLVLLNTSALGLIRNLISIQGNNNQILGCYIGTTGILASASNAKYGIYIDGGANNKIGDGTKAGVNVISGIGNYGYGVYITGGTATDNSIQGNIIGLQANGSTLISGGNFQLYGIYITSNASNNIIGGIGAEDGNVISGQYGQYSNSSPKYTGVGVYLNSAALAGNTIIGNRIGMRSDGATYVTSNTQGYGILINNSRNNIIGGNSSTFRNVLSGNELAGIFIKGISSTNNSIKGNYIGPQVNGTSYVLNSTQYAGIKLSSAGTGNMIGGTGIGEGNLISGASSNGLFNGVGSAGVLMNATSSTLIAGNIIGLQSDGNTMLASPPVFMQYSGIYIDSASTNNIIGGTTNGARNILSGNSGYGIEIGFVYAGCSGNSIKGNYIGLQSDGITIVAGNTQLYGVSISTLASNNIVGGTTFNERNIISGNINFGIYFSSGANANTVSGNIIGLTKNGTAVAASAQTRGIQFQDGANNNVIGGNTPAQRNYISGNTESGINFVDNNGFTANSSGNIIKGNYIGSDTTGTSFIAIQSRGFMIGNTGISNTIGGTGIGEGNLISGNNTGVTVGGNSNIIIGNIIGPKKDGISNLASNSQGVGIDIQAQNTVIGGITPAYRNIISANLTAGIFINGAGAYNTLIKGNYLGPSSALSSIIGSNQDYGIYIDNSAHNNTIGGVGVGEANIMAYNTVYGSYITQAGTNQNKISGSPHYSNIGKPINLNYGVNGGNNNKPIPVISNVTTSTVTGTSAAGDVVEVFKNTSTSCFDAQVYLGAATANGSGNWSLAVSLITTDKVLATARDASNNTSEFTNCAPVCPTVYSSQNPTICSNGSFTLPDGSHANTTGVYLDTLISIDGCDSIITTTLTVKPISTHTQNITMCYGDSILVGSTYYYNSGNYTTILVAANTCDSIVTTHLTELPAVVFSQNIKLCPGQSITVGTHTYNTTGTYHDTLVATNGCDSSVTTNLTIKPTSSYTQNVTLCYGDSILVGTTYYHTSGNYTDVLISANGCDSTVTTNLTISNAITSSISLVICNGDSIIVGTTPYYHTGNYTTVLTAANGCDSTVFTNLIENPLITYNQNITMCYGDSILVGSNYYYNSGNYTTILTAANGCDSIVSTNLIENPLVALTQNVTICYGDSLLVGNTYYYHSGNYTNVLTAHNGCDSTVTTNLIESPLVTYIQNISLCFGQSIIVGTHTYNTSGTYIDSLITKNGCDSLVTTNLIIKPVFSSSQSLTICFGDSVLVGTTPYYHTGIYTTVLTAINGCDSTVTTNLTEKPLIETSQNVTLCAGQSITVGAHTYNTSGTYVDVYTAADGCDSLFTTYLNIIQPIITYQSHTILCLGQTYALPGGSSVNAPGIYHDTVTAISTNCDSIIITTVTIAPAPIASFTATPTSGTLPLPVSFTNTSLNANTYWWTFGDGNSSTLTNPSNVYENAGVYTVYLIVSNGSTCYDTAKLDITVYKKYTITPPNIFTPNGDGINDYFTIPSEGIKTLQGGIYDRWGLKLFDWIGVNGNWDGVTLSGEPASEGTYYYILKATDYDDKTYTEKGYFMLMR